MRAFVGSIESLAAQNRDFRRILFTADHMQLVLMTLEPDEATGSEVHAAHDQFLRIEEGYGEVRLGNKLTQVMAGDAIVVPAGTLHNLSNTGQQPLRLYTIYSPPEHADQLVEATKAMADMHHARRAAERVAAHGNKDMIDEGSPVVASVTGHGA